MTEETPIRVARVGSEKYSDALSTLESALDAPVSFLQAPLYGKLQERSGKDVVYFVATRGETPIACGLAVRYTAPLGMNFLYCPYGPIAQTWTPELYDALRRFFTPLARELGCAFVRFDTNELVNSSVAKPIPSETARTASLQPRAEWLLSITPSADDIWMGFHKHARYNVRLAERANAQITVHTPAEAPLDDFYHLMQTTGGRDAFGIFDKSYYESYLQTLTAHNGFMVMCRIDEKPAAAGLFVLHDKQAHYVFAGSSDDFRKIGPAYSVIWTAIQEAKQRSCQVFNFGGITDDVKGHDLAGVTSFKKRFGGYAVTHHNPVDLVYSRPHYALFTVLKKLGR